jgi:hypothetical protein
LSGAIYGFMVLRIIGGHTASKAGRASRTGL